MFFIDLLTAPARWPVKLDDYRLGFFQADLVNPHEIEQIVPLTLSAYGHLDIVVNNAAILLPKSIDQVSVAEWDQLMAVNLRAPFLVIKAALPALKASRGNVLNIGSTAAIRVFTENMPYSTAKGGLVTMTKSLALELHPYKIRVNCLCPGAVDTPFLQRDIQIRGHDEHTLERLTMSAFPAG